MEISVCEITEPYGCSEMHVFSWSVDRGAVEGRGLLWRWSEWVDVATQGGGRFGEYGPMEIQRSGQVGKMAFPYRELYVRGFTFEVTPLLKFCE